MGQNKFTVKNVSQSLFKKKKISFEQYNMFSIYQEEGTKR